MAKIVVTGGAGFIGRAVVRKLLDNKHDVRVLDNLSKGSYTSYKNEEVVKVDLLDRKRTKKYFIDADYCIHLAAKIGGIGYFHKYPATIISENNLMLSSVFDACVENKLKRIIYVSSSMVYESATIFPSKESDIKSLPIPKTAYGFSKLIGEKYCGAYFDQYGLFYSIVRPFNAYGKYEYPGDEEGMAHVIPDVLRKVFSGQYPIEILGDGKQVRCFTHVDDIARGIVTVMGHRNSLNQVYNIANANPTSINDLVKMIWSLSNQKKPLKITYKKGFSSDVQKRIPDVIKAKKMLDWSAKTDLEEGLKEVIEWYKSVYAKT